MNTGKSGSAAIYRLKIGNSGSDATSRPNTVINGSDAILRQNIWFKCHILSNVIS